MFLGNRVRSMNYWVESLPTYCVLTRTCMCGGLKKKKKKKKKDQWIREGEVVVSYLSVGSHDPQAESGAYCLTHNKEHFPTHFFLIHSHFPSRPHGDHYGCAGRAMWLSPGQAWDGSPSELTFPPVVCCHVNRVCTSVARLVQTLEGERNLKINSVSVNYQIWNSVASSYCCLW